MKRFSDYLRLRTEDVDPPVAPDAPDAPSDDEDMDPAEEKLLDACEIAVEKYRPQLEKFLRRLAENDSELRGALDGTGAAAPTPDAAPDVQSPSLPGPTAPPAPAV
jgi:hypothetical protein